ncbi:MAG: L,D-transpeptidase family protein [Parvularculaceae bacterium]
MNFLRVILLITVCALFTGCARNVFTPPPAPEEKSAERAATLIAAIEGLAEEGLDPTRYDPGALRAAIASRDAARIDGEAQTLFLRAAADVNAGAIAPADRQRWKMAPSEPDLIAIHTAADKAFRNGDFDDAFASLAPTNDQYARLKKALVATADPELRARIALNMDRWRWMPRDLGSDYVLVNAAAFELYVYRNRKLVDRRRVVVGSPSLPTPQIAATATGVAFNPTWFVPPSIVAESVGALMENDPERAAALGYYRTEDGGVRQKPGPANALGRMKLIMPNPYSVFLHDTPGKDAFKRDMRAMSHGCVRVDGAVDFAKELLGKSLSDDELKDILASTAPREVAFEKPIPIYIGYFTADVDEAGTLSTYPDVYGLDASLLPSFGATSASASQDAIKSLIIESCPEIAEGAASENQ